MAATVLEQDAVFGDTIPRGSWVAGDILYAFVAATGTLQTPSGWTATPALDVDVGIFFRQLTPADDAVTSWTFTAAGGSVVFIRYVVIRGGAAVDAYTGVVNASGAAHTVSLTTTSDDSLLVVLGASNAGGTWSLPGGWTSVYNSGEIIATRVQATAGATGNVTFTTSGSAEAWLAMIAVSPPAASVTIPRIMHHYRQMRTR